MEKIDWKYEIISTFVLFLAIVVILPALKVEDSVVWLAAIIVGVSALMLVGIKIYFFTQKKYLENSINKLMNDFSERAGNIVNPMFSKISTMSEPGCTYANKIISKTAQQIEEIANGIIRLNESEYFEEIISEVDKMQMNETILAVSAFDERRFVQDPREIGYFDKNKEAVSNRNVIINRIFIYDDTVADTNVCNERLAVIKKNFDAGINVFIVFKSKLKGLTNANELCEDAVMFEHNNEYPRLYIDYPDNYNGMRVSHGELRINASHIELFTRHFNRLKTMAISEQDKLNLLKAI